MRHGGRWYSGRRSWTTPTRREERLGPRGRVRARHDVVPLVRQQQPLLGRVFHTFERACVDDKSTWTEPKNPYFDHWEDEDAVRMILSEFGLDPESGHIINGHTPVKATKGESPVKAGGRLFIIDGGFCKAYQKTTGIAGYTLIYSSHGVRLKSHRLRGRGQGAQRERGHGV